MLVKVLRTIGDFRALHLDELAALFVQVVKPGTVAIDGAKVKASASRHEEMGSPNGNSIRSVRPRPALHGRVGYALPGQPPTPLNGAPAWPPCREASAGNRR